MAEWTFRSACGPRASRTPQRADPALGSGDRRQGNRRQAEACGPVLLGDLGGDVWIDRSLKPADRDPGGDARRSPSTRRTRRSKPSSPPGRSRGFRCRRASPDKWTIDQRIRASFDPEAIRRPLRGAEANTFHRSPSRASAMWRPTAASGTTTGGYRSCSGAKAWRLRTGRIIFRRSTSSRRSPRRLALPIPAPIDGRCLERIEGVTCPVR